MAINKENSNENKKKTGLEEYNVYYLYSMD